MLCFYSDESRRDGTLSIVEAECSRVVSKKVNEAIDDNVAWPRGWVMKVAFHDYVFTGLNLCFATWAASGKCKGTA